MSFSKQEQAVNRIESLLRAFEMSFSRHGPTDTWKAVVFRPNGHWGRGADLSIAIASDELVVMFGGEFREELSLTVNEAEVSITYAESLVGALIANGFTRRLWKRGDRLIRAEAEVVINKEPKIFKVYQLAIPCGGSMTEEKYPPFMNKVS